MAIYNNFYEDKAQELGLSDTEYRHRMGTIFRSLSEPSRQRAVINTDSGLLPPTSTQFLYTMLFSYLVMHFEAHQHAKFLCAL